MVVVILSLRGVGLTLVVFDVQEALSAEVRILFTLADIDEL